MKWVFKAKKIASIPLKPWDCDESCFSWIYIFHGKNGHVYYCYDHNDWLYCPLKNIPIEYCEDLKECKNCSNCPNTEYFVYLENKEDLIPVKCLTE